MLFAVHAGVGDGILYLMLGCAGGSGMLGWVGFWLARGFRADGLTSRTGRRVLWGAFGSVVTTAVCLPPLHRTGNWREDPGGEPVAPAARSALDRDYFGCVPRFAWVGVTGTEEPMPLGAICQSSSEGVGARCDRYRWAVDYPLLVAEVVCCALLVLPFARVRERSNRAEPGAAPDPAI